MRLYTDEIVNAVCLNQAERRGVKPADVEVQLAWDEDTGYTAEIWVSGRSMFLVEANLLEALEQYVFKQYGRRVYRSQIRLDLDEEAEEFIADIAQ